MFQHFFHDLRSAKVPVTLKEHLDPAREPWTRALSVATAAMR